MLNHKGNILVFLLIVVLVVGGAAFFLVKPSKKPPQSANCSSQSKIYTNLEEALQNPEQVCFLDLSRQNLTSVPESVFKLTSLQTLLLSSNQITEVPDKISSLKTLYTIDLTGNPLSQDEMKKVRTLLPNANVVFLLPMSLSDRTSPAVDCDGIEDNGICYPANVIKSLQSPNGMYIAIEQQVGGGLYFVIKKQEDSIICDDIAGKNFSTYPEKKEYFTTRGSHISSWSDNSHLVIDTRIADEGPLYKYIVDVNTCLADLNSIREVK